MPITGPLRSVVLMSCSALAAAALGAVAAAARRVPRLLRPRRLRRPRPSSGLGLGFASRPSAARRIVRRPRLVGPAARPRPRSAQVRAEGRPLAVAVGADGQAARPRDRPRPCPPRGRRPIRRMPFTPLELRPIGRASDSLEADGHAAGGGEHHFVAGLGHHHVDQLVALAELDGDDAALHAAGCRPPGRSSSPARRRWPSQVVVGLVEVADGAAVGDLLALGEVQQVDDRPAAAVAGQLRQVVDLAPVDLALGW